LSRGEGRRIGREEKEGEGGREKGGREKKGGEEREEKGKFR